MAALGNPWVNNMLIVDYANGAPNVFRIEIDFTIPPGEDSTVGNDHLDELRTRLETGTSAEVNEYLRLLHKKAVSAQGAYSESSAGTQTAHKIIDAAYAP